MSSAPKFGTSESISMDSLVAKVSEIVADIAGIQLGPKQAHMVESRLKARMLKLGLQEPDQYHNRLLKHRDEETEHLLSLLTTHHTYFFREYSQFEFLETQIPSLVEKVRTRGDRTIRLWSAACSKGQEVYSLAMFMDFQLTQYPDVKFEILGTDVDPQSVRFAENGVYAWNELKEVPMHFLKDNWIRGKGDISNFGKVAKKIRTKCFFKTENLLKLESFRPSHKFDIIFCRNVFIYFNQDQIKQATLSLLKYLQNDGQFYVGISESLSGKQLPVETCGTSIYCKKQAQLEQTNRITLSPVIPIHSASKKTLPTAPIDTSLNMRPMIQQDIRVLIVDDSPTVVALLKKVFTYSGYTVAGTANNGTEALDFLKHNKVDAITLDIHMPVMDGVTFLKQTKGTDRPPVIVVSSVSREDAHLSLEVINLGALDYVEKPTLQDLSSRSEEIRNKIKVATRLKGQTVASNIDTAFRSQLIVKNPELALRVIVTSVGDAQRVQALLNVRDHGNVDTLILLYGGGSAIAAVAKLFNAQEAPSDFKIAGKANISVADYDQFKFKIGLASKISISLCGVPQDHVLRWGRSVPGARLIFEDTGNMGTLKLNNHADEVIPLTSHFYNSTLWFSKG